MSPGTGAASCGAPPARRSGTRHRAGSLFLVLTTVAGLFVAGSRTVEAAALTGMGWSVSNNQASATAVNYALSLKTTSTGTIKTITATLSAGALGGAPVIVVNYGIGAGSVARAGNIITYTVTAAVSVAAGIPIFIELSGLTNPVAGTDTMALATNTVVPSVIDNGTSPSVTFAAGNSAKSIVVAKSLTFTLDTTAFTIAMDPSLPALADQSFTSNITVLTNANSGYSLTILDNAAGLQCSCAGNPVIPDLTATMAAAVVFPGPPANTTGYTVTGTGVGDPGFAVNAAFTGSKYAGMRNAGDVVATSSTATGATANTIAITDRTAIDYASPAGTYTDTVTYTVTPNYT